MTPRTATPKSRTSNAGAVRDVILATLLNNNGTGTPAGCYEAVGRALPKMARTEDVDYLTRWARMGLVKDGLVAKSRQRGVWKLTAKGRRAAAARQDAGAN